MAVSLSSLTPVVQTYGCLFLPIAADFGTTLLFKQATSDNKAHVAGLAAGMGVLFFSGRQTSLVIGLTGAVLYLIYKVITANFSHQKKPIPDMIIANSKWLELEKSITYVFDEVLNYEDPDFMNKLLKLNQALENRTRPIEEQWANPAFLIKIQETMQLCQTILFEIHTSFERQTAEMAVLLQDPSHDKPKRVFKNAFNLLNKVYRMVRTKGYVISLPNIQNGPHKKCYFLSYNFIADDAKPFFKDGTPECAMRTIFNTTQEKLYDLIHLLYPDSPLTAKDEENIPGDYEGSNSPFKIKYV